MESKFLNTSSVAGNIAPPVKNNSVRHNGRLQKQFRDFFRKTKRPFVQFFAPIDVFLYRSRILKQVEREFPTILSLNETVDLLIRGASICRFGDGEFHVILRWSSVGFQTPKSILARRMAEVLSTPSTDQLVIAIPPLNPPYNNPPNQYSWMNWWQKFWTKRWTTLRKKLMNRTFGNSFISRDAGFYEVEVEKYRQIWADRDVVFITGKGGCFFDEQRLFDNIKSVEYLFVDAAHAYRKYDAVLQQALTFDKNKLFIICAGFMATVLAFDLYHHGYQALDMGHLPNCYRQYLGETGSPESLG